MHFFKRGASGSADEDGFWVVAASDEIAADAITKVTVAGKPVIVTRWQGALIAFSAHCPHAAADLSGGQIYRGRIDCPDHDYRFDLVSGRALWPPDEPCRLQKYEVKEQAGVVKVKARL